MRVIALLALIFGFTFQLLLDGQPYSHAVFGIICGMAVVACGLRSAHLDPPNRWEGRIMAGLGLALGVWCVGMLPSAYRIQERFNHRSEPYRKMREQKTPATNAPHDSRALPSGKSGATAGPSAVN